MNKYRVLWIDDKHDQLNDIKISAELNDINLTCCKTAREGINILRAKLYHWDGIILDAKGYNETENEVDKLTGMSKVIKTVSELKSERYIPLYIFTGQPDTKGKDHFDEMLDGFDLKAYSKNTDREQLFRDIKFEADKLPETQLRHKYSHVFIKGIDENLLLEILRILDKNESRNSDVFNKTRLMFECTLTICKEVGLIDERITKVEKAKEILKGSNNVPIHIQNSLDSFITSSQVGSHYETLLKDVNDGKYPDIVSATIKGLLSYITWLDNFRKDCKTVSKRD